MCGIAGVYLNSSGKEINRNMFERVVSGMKHRGPDHTAVAFHEHIALGHVRLSVIDTSQASNQPFYAADRSMAMVFNGEIFNYKQLRDELMQQGIVFSTQSDTEVLLHLLAQKGIEALNKINGFFAFAWYNFKTQTLVLARDRFGEKPLFYHYNQVQKDFYFASELKAVTAFLPERKLNAVALRLLLELSYVPNPHTIVEDVFKLNPGCYVVLNEKGINIQKWYTLTPKVNEGQTSETAYLQQIRTTFEQAVQRRMVSDVPVAGFLSGGIDSSLVSCYAHDFNASYETFSLGFSENKYIDESEDALFAAKHYGIKHNAIRLSENELLENAHEILAKADEPFGDSSMIALYSLCKKIKGQYKVILSGDGADEVFAGYHKHYALYRAQNKGLANTLIKNGGFAHKLLPKSRNTKFGNKARQLQKMYELLNQNAFEQYWYTVGFNAKQALELFKQPASISAFKQALQNDVEANDFNRFLLYDLKLVLPGDMLYKVDRASMLNGIEMRSPFLDHELIELAFGIPGELKIKNSSKKYLLKTAFKDRLPDKLLHKPKHGFEVPLQQWMKGPFYGLIETTLLRGEIVEQGIFDVQRIQKMVKKMSSNNPGDAATTLWILLNFQASWKKINNA